MNLVGAGRGTRQQDKDYCAPVHAERRRGERLRRSGGREEKVESKDGGGIQQASRDFPLCGFFLLIFSVFCVFSRMSRWLYVYHKKVPKCTLQQ